MRTIKIKDAKCKMKEGKFYSEMMNLRTNSKNYSKCGVCAESYSCKLMGYKGRSANGEYSVGKTEQRSKAHVCVNLVS
jgi:hypothetical protein